MRKTDLDAMDLESLDFSKASLPIGVEVGGAPWMQLDRDEWEFLAVMCSRHGKRFDHNGLTALGSYAEAVVRWYDRGQLPALKLEA